MPRSLVLFLGALLPFAALSQDEPTLRLRGKKFIIRDGAQVLQVPLAETPTPHSDRVVYRKDANFVVWDSRGLTIRKGKKVNTTRLPEIALTPKLFSNEQIAQTKKLLKRKVRSKGADRLSGSAKVGDKAYLLLRWDQKDGTAWLEALVSIDLSSKDLHAKLLGAFDGRTLGVPGTNAMFADNGFIRALVRKADRSWGISSFDSSDQSFAFKSVGHNLLDFWHLDSRTALVEEHSSFNSKTLARVDTDSCTRRVIYEFQGDASFLSTGTKRLMRFSTPDGDLLRNMDSGAELKIGKDDAARAAGHDVVVWPRNQPENAVLYSPERWNRLATVEQN